MTVYYQLSHIDSDDLKNSFISYELRGQRMASVSSTNDLYFVMGWPISS